ncbi:MAG: HAMP domain-containing histidine kinase [Anaerolineaceae bacterium]|nr:HAMP domain-containing histidine kinase [Anaerolineaceae bacterium]
MSLRLRLTIIYTTLLSGVVLLLSIVVYSMVSVVVTNQVDAELEQSANQIIDTMRADAAGEMIVAVQDLNLPSTMYYQVWSLQNQLLNASENAGSFEAPMDSTYPEKMAAPTYKDVQIQTEPFRVLTVPLTVEGQVNGWLQVGIQIFDLRYTQRLLIFVLSIAALFSIIVGGVVGWMVTGQALEPLETMAEVTRQITSTDDLSKRIPVVTGSNDEINELVLSFNQTLVRLERLFNSQRRFLADVSHELRTPLTVIKGNVGLMRMMNEVDDESLSSIEAEVDRLTRLVGDLLLMAQAETGRMPLTFEPVEIDELVFEVFEQMKTLSGGKHDIRIKNIEPAIVSGDRDRLKQVLLNIGSNAVKFTPEGQQIWFNLAVSGNWVQIEVVDRGPGISKEEIQHIFERFYRGDKSRTRSQKDVGFGLGLPIAYWIVRNHGGRIDVDSKVGDGTVFTIWLPISLAEIPTRPLRTLEHQPQDED